MNKKDTEQRKNTSQADDDRDNLGVANWLEKRLTIALIEGRWGPEDSLPSEIKICQEYGVSPNTCKEVRRRLVAKGVLEVQKGSGTRVTKDFHPYMLRDDPNLVIRLAPKEFSDMLEFRQNVELICANLAVTNATKGDLVAMSVALNLMKENQNDPLVFSRAESDFHFALIGATHNTMWVRALDAVRGDFFAFIAEANEAGVSPQSLPAHEALYQALENKNHFAATQAMATILALAKEASDQVVQLRKENQDQQSRIIAGRK